MMCFLANSCSKLLIFCGINKLLYSYGIYSISTGLQNPTNVLEFIGFPYP